MEGGQNFFFAW